MDEPKGGSEEDGVTVLTAVETESFSGYIWPRLYPIAARLNAEPRLNLFFVE